MIKTPPIINCLLLLCVVFWLGACGKKPKNVEAYDATPPAMGQKKTPAPPYYPRGYPDGDLHKLPAKPQPARK